MPRAGSALPRAHGQTVAPAPPYPLPNPPIVASPSATRLASLGIALTVATSPINAGCNNDPAPAPAALVSASSQPEWPAIGAAEPTRLHSVGDRANGGGYRFSVDRAQPCTVQPYFPPQRGRTRIGVEVTVENTSDAPILVNPFYARLHDQSEFVYYFTLAGCDPTLDAGLLAPGETSRGWLSFDVRQSARELQLEYSPLHRDGSIAGRVRFGLGDAPAIIHASRSMPATIVP